MPSTRSCTPIPTTSKLPAADAKAMAGLGSNVVRLGRCYHSLRPGTGRTSMIGPASASGTPGHTTMFNATLASRYLTNLTCSALWRRHALGYAPRRVQPSASATRRTIGGVHQRAPESSRLRSPQLDTITTTTPAAADRRNTTFWLKRCALNQDSAPRCPSFRRRQTPTWLGTRPYENDPPPKVVLICSRAIDLKNASTRPIRHPGLDIPNGCTADGRCQHHVGITESAVVWCLSKFNNCSSAPPPELARTHELSPILTTTSTPPVSCSPTHTIQ